MDGRDLSDDLARETALLRRIARGIVLEPGLAEDAVQEAWLAALRARPAAEHLGGWMNEAVRRIAHGMRRGQARRTARERAASRPESIAGADEAASRVELLRELLDALRSLEEPYRTAVQLRLVEDLPPREIAARTGVPVETARTRFKRGVQRLREQLDARHGDRRDEFLSALAPLVALGGLGFIGSFAGSKAAGGTGMGLGAKAAAAGIVALAAGLWWASARSERTSGEAELVAAAPETSAAAPIEPETEQIATKPTASSVSERTSVDDDAAASESAAADRWSLRVRTVRKASSVADARFRLSLISGYEGDGALLHEQVATTGADGSVALELERPEGGFRIRASGEMTDHKCWRNEVLVARGAQPPSEIELRLYPLDVTVNGLVLADDGEPIADARVEGLGSEDRTDRAGRFSVRGSTDLEEASVTAYAPGFATRRVVLEADEPGATEQVEIRLAPGAVLRGRVVDEHGEPVAGALVEELDLTPAGAVADDDGRFALDGLQQVPDRLVLRVRAEGFASLLHAFVEGRVPEGEVVLALQRGREVRGLVADEHGAPVPGARALPDDGFNHREDTAVADDEGRFTLRNVASSHASFTVTADGFAPFSGPLPQGGGPLEVYATLSRGWSLSGSVVDEAGEPIAAAWISVRKGSGHRSAPYVGAPQIRSDASGRFALAGLPSNAELELGVHAPGFVPAALPLDPPRDREIRVEMRRSAGLAGRVIDASTRAPIARFRIRFVSADLQPGEEPLSGFNSKWWIEGVEIQDADGRWDTSGEDLRPGQIATIEISAAGYGTAIVPRAVTIHDASTRPIEVALDAGARVRGRVVDSDGQPIAGAVVRRFTPRDEDGDVWRDDEDGKRATLRTDGHGEFAFEGLPREPMSLYVEAAGLAPAVDGPFDPTTDLTTREIRLGTGASVTGAVLDLDGAPEAGAVVWLSVQSSPGLFLREWRVTTGTDGSFRFEGLPAAEYWISRRLEHGGVAAGDLSQRLVVEANGERRIELRPPGRLSLRGSLRGVRSPRTTAVNAWCLDGSGLVQSRSALAIDGKFEFEGMLSGPWKLSVYGVDEEGRDFGGRTTVELAPGGAPEAVIDCELDDRPGRVR